MIQQVCHVSCHIAQAHQLFIITDSSEDSRH
jgi:hypothetical protein